MSERTWFCTLVGSLRSSDRREDNEPKLDEELEIVDENDDEEEDDEEDDDDGLFLRKLIGGWDNLKEEEVVGILRERGREEREGSKRRYMLSTREEGSDQ